MSDALARRQVALEVTRRSFSYAEARFAAGDIAWVELLAALRPLHEAETANLHAQTTAAVQLVTLYQAIAGGWNPADAPAFTPIS